MDSVLYEITLALDRSMTTSDLRHGRADFESKQLARGL